MSDERFEFHKEMRRQDRHYSGKVCCSKFIQETVYQISSESPEFCRRYYKKRFGLFFSGHTVYAVHNQKQFNTLIVTRIERDLLITPTEFQSAIT